MASKTKSRRRLLSRSRGGPGRAPAPIPGFAEGFGTVTAVIGGAFAIASMVLIGRAVSAEAARIPGRPDKWWLAVQALASTAGYLLLAAGGGGLAADRNWGRKMLSGAAGLLVAVAALDGFLTFAAVSGTGQSTSVIFWPVAWGIFPLIALILANVSALNVGAAASPPAPGTDEPAEAPGEVPSEPARDSGAAPGPQAAKEKERK